jgi:hypothetical protein
MVLRERATRSVWITSLCVGDQGYPLLTGNAPGVLSKGVPMATTIDECWPAVVPKGIIVHCHRPSADCNNRCHVVADMSQITR